jgi:hypothetical protein
MIYRSSYILTMNNNMKAILGMCLIMFFNSCCKNDTVIVRDPIEYKEAKFIIRTNGVDSGLGKIFYSFYGEKIFLLGNEESMGLWNVDCTNNVSELIYEIPKTSNVKYLFNVDSLDLNNNFMLKIIYGSELITDSVHSSSFSISGNFGT